MSSHADVLRMSEVAIAISIRKRSDYLCQHTNLRKAASSAAAPASRAAQLT